ncbi:hypothetical protein [Flavobacterium franklandianum]|uniref:Uncharacterized protein n=1 Tax=Flavobacterium franklandianum TaxID=2594430 RepID=A0A553C898_9FLAO|nr:hypothetical protein [Flavobacterium franklandianum]TRX16738.1 hypothetical protein FNW17_12310 [Flavobacterium franklandianum]
MQYLNPTTYVQYITANGVIKVKQVERQVESNEIIYNLDGINEDFFILGVYDLNKRVLGVTFGNVENLEMISFLNSDFQSVEALPKNSFFPPNTMVSIFKDTLNYNINFDVINTPKVNLWPFYNPYRYYVELNGDNREIEGVSLSISEGKIHSYFIDTLSLIRSYQNDQLDLIPIYLNGCLHHNFYGFEIYIELDVPCSFDFLIDTKFNIFDIVPTESVINTNSVKYVGYSKGFHKYIIYEDLDYISPASVVFVAYKVPAGYVFVPF